MAKVIQLSQGYLEGPVLDALAKYAPRPRERDALKALSNEEVRGTALCLAEKVRNLARDHDEKTLAGGGKSIINYRGFYVASVGVGLKLGRNAGQAYEWWAFAAVNSKPTKKAEKYCAEMRVIRAARDTRCSCIGGLVVIGENQPDQRSGKVRNTLNPCGECRDFMRSQGQHMLRPRSLIVTKLPVSQYSYEEPLRQMMSFHGETWP